MKSIFKMTAIAALVVASAACTRIETGEVGVRGEARGADSLGKKLTTEMGWGVQSFPADWKKNGKSAGYKRNEEMAQNADALIAFWDGESKGTKHMIDIAKRYRLPTRIVKY